MPWLFRNEDILSMLSALARTLLVSVGYFDRSMHDQLMTMSRSSLYLNAISNRLAASSPRARLLGMVVAEAVSMLVDPPKTAMKFDIDGMNTQETRSLRDLTTIKDDVGHIINLQGQSPPLAKLQKSDRDDRQRSKEGGQKTRPDVKTPFENERTKVLAIEELDSSESLESSDDDLPSYPKPDSDDSDSEEDPTLVQRNKSTAPVYIIDLLAGLRDSQNFDRHALALKTASSLIRRKAAFGTEVSSNIVDLASLLTGLHDTFSFDNFHDLRLQAMVATVVAQPKHMGQWYASSFFDGDYSLAQRASILTAMGLGAREVAGYGKEDAAVTGSAKSPDAMFPSQKLPDRLHALYGSSARQPNSSSTYRKQIKAPQHLDALAQNLSTTYLRPLAISAADKVTGPSALKVRTFSSRMDVEKKAASRKIDNNLASVVAEGFIYPLTGRFRLVMQSPAYNSGVYFEPFLLSTFLRTIALILHASGPSTLALPQMTAEVWNLLLSLRHAAADDVVVLEGLLFALLTLLELNSNQSHRVAVDLAKELLETREWVGSIFESLPAGSGPSTVQFPGKSNGKESENESDRIRTLAAGVMVRTGDIVEQYQRTLMGSMVDF